MPVVIQISLGHRGNCHASSGSRHSKLRVSRPKQGESQRTPTCYCSIVVQPRLSEDQT